MAERCDVAVVVGSEFDLEVMTEAVSIHGVAANRRSGAKERR